jgi:hypothetical protein
VNAFIVEYSQYLETIIMSTDPLIITGDFNIHVNSKTDGDSLKFVDLLLSMGWHVEFSRHVSGNTLDLVITREVDSILGPPPRRTTFSLITWRSHLGLIPPNYLLQRNV